MTKEDRKLINSPQFKQWQRLGLAEIIVDLKVQTWVWTAKGKEIPYNVRVGVANLAKGDPIYPVEKDRAAVEPLIKKDWRKFGFNEYGYFLVDE